MKLFCCLFFVIFFAVLSLYHFISWLLFYRVMPFLHPLCHYVSSFLFSAQCDIMFSSAESLISVQFIITYILFVSCMVPRTSENVVSGKNRRLTGRYHILPVIFSQDNPDPFSAGLIIFQYSCLLPRCIADVVRYF